jgi:hypothetical protein
MTGCNRILLSDITSDGWHFSRYLLPNKTMRGVRFEPYGSLNDGRLSPPYPHAMPILDQNVREGFNRGVGNVQTMRHYLIFTFIMVVLLGFITGCVAPGPDGNITTPPQTISSPSPTPTIIEDARTCTLDSDCVPEQCCHPISCINRRFKGVCTVLCTQVCEGPIDCGAGHCGCEGETCQVISSPGALNGTGVQPEGAMVAYVGEEINLTGTNTASDTTYLFLTGPNLSPSGGRLDSPFTPVIDGDPASFTHTPVQSDHTWNYKWQTSTLGIDAGTYVIYVESAPRSRGKISDMEYTTIPVILV